MDATLTKSHQGFLWKSDQPVWKRTSGSAPFADEGAGDNHEQ